MKYNFVRKQNKSSGISSQYKLYISFFVFLFISNVATASTEALGSVSEITPALIKTAYQLILGREAESEEVVEEKAKRLKTVDELREEFIRSVEFGAALRRDRATMAYHRLLDDRAAEPLEIDLDVSQTQLELIFQRVKEEWTKLGDEEPHWSVLTNEKYKQSFLATEAKEEFFKTGKNDFDLLESFSKRNKVAIPKGKYLELGCGVGRVTQFLAQSCVSIDAVDVSAPNLRLCMELLKTKNIDNCNPILLSTPEDLSQLEQYDIFFSQIVLLVLQHNPPPVQKYVLNIILSKISSGGICLFQIPTRIPGYVFKIDYYLSSKKPVLEMHCLPFFEIMKLLESNDFSVMEVLTDGSCGYGMTSHTFFARKK